MDISAVLNSGTFAFASDNSSRKDGEFQDMVNGMLSENTLSGQDETLWTHCPQIGQCFGSVVISPKAQALMRENSELCESITSQIEALSKNTGNNSHDDLIIVDRNGEVCRYSTKDDTPTHPTKEELREAAKARARKKARLDAYFHRLEKVCIKRKLVEIENAGRKSKKYRLPITLLDRLAESQRITSPPDPLAFDSF